MLFVRCYPRETRRWCQPPTTDAVACSRDHACAGNLRQHEDGGGRRIRRQRRLYNSRFMQMCSHYWSIRWLHASVGMGGKGQVETRLGLTGAFFTAAAAVQTLDELNAWLMDKCSPTQGRTGARIQELPNRRSGVFEPSDEASSLAGGSTIPRGAGIGLDDCMVAGSTKINTSHGQRCREAARFTLRRRM